MRNKGLIITLIIILVIIIIGLILLLVGCLNGNFRIMNGLKFFETQSENIIVDESFDFEKINDIDVFSESGDIIFEKAADNRIRVVAYGQKDDKCNVDLNENNLTIDYSEKKNNLFSFNFYLNDIIVYIPTNYEGNIDITNKYGDCKVIDIEGSSISINADCGDINIGIVNNLKVKGSYGDINANTILNDCEIEADCGDVELGQVENLKLKCDYGDIKLGTILNKCDIKSDCGDVDIENMQIKENSTIKSDYGDVKIEEKSDFYIEADVDLGDVKIDENNRNSDITLKIENDCGDVKVGE